MGSSVLLVGSSRPIDDIELLDVSLGAGSEMRC